MNSERNSEVNQRNKISNITNLYKTKQMFLFMSTPMYYCFLTRNWSYLSTATDQIHDGFDGD